MKNIPLLSRLGSWLLLATICINYLGGGYELVLTAALISIALITLPWITREFVSLLLGILLVIPALAFLPVVIRGNFLPAPKLLIGSGLLLLLISLWSLARRLLWQTVFKKEGAAE